MFILDPHFQSVVYFRPPMSEASLSIPMTFREGVNPPGCSSPYTSTSSPTINAFNIMMRAIASTKYCQAKDNIEDEGEYKSGGGY